MAFRFEFAPLASCRSMGVLFALLLSILVLIVMRTQEITGGCIYSVALTLLANLFLLTITPRLQALAIGTLMATAYNTCTGVSDTSTDPSSVLITVFLCLSFITYLSPKETACLAWKAISSCRAVLPNIAFLMFWIGAFVNFGSRASDHGTFVLLLTGCFYFIVQIGEMKEFQWLMLYWMGSCAYLFISMAVLTVTPAGIYILFFAWLLAMCTTLYSIISPAENLQTNENATTVSIADANAEAPLWPARALRRPRPLAILILMFPVVGGALGVFYFASSVIVPAMLMFALFYFVSGLFYHTEAEHAEVGGQAAIMTPPPLKVHLTYWGLLLPALGLFTAASNWLLVTCINAGDAFGKSNDMSITGIKWLALWVVLLIILITILCLAVIPTKDPWHIPTGWSVWDFILVIANTAGAIIMVTRRVEDPGTGAFGENLVSAAVFALMDGFQFLFLMMSARTGLNTIKATQANPQAPASIAPAPFVWPMQSVRQLMYVCNFWNMYCHQRIAYYAFLPESQLTSQTRYGAVTAWIAHVLMIGLSIYNQPEPDETTPAQAAAETDAQTGGMQQLA